MSTRNAPSVNATRSKAPARLSLALPTATQPVGPAAMVRDQSALALLLIAIGIVIARAIGDISAFIRGDWPTAFLPWYSFLGERLRAFDIPGWNPFQFSGTPFIADPSSGWMYLPAMVIYALFAPEPATGIFVATHIVLSSLAAYALARLTGLSPAGALIAGLAYGLPWLLPASAGSVLMVQVTTWAPIALIGVELGRAPGSPARSFAGLALSGLAVSQILASWLGQGSYYAFLVIGGWVLWRTLVTPPAQWSLQTRLVACFTIGISGFLLGFAFNAAALLVRLEANARSNAAGGMYSGVSGWADTKTGSTLPETIRSLGGGFGEASWQYVGAAVIALALLAPIVAPRWPPLLFWLIAPIAAIILILPERNAFQDLAFAVLPRFELVQGHLPERVLQVVPLSAAMLAGATGDRLAQGCCGTRWRSMALLFAAVAVAIGAVALQRAGLLSRASLLAALAVLVIASCAIALPATGRAILLPMLLAVIVVWDPTARVLAAGWGPDQGPERSLNAALAGKVDAFLYENGAAAFLRDATHLDPGRYAGYDPALLPDAEARDPLPPQAYRNHWLGPANWLLVQNWGTWFRIEDVQGYNPIQIGRYSRYVDALNGFRQEYHETDVFPEGLDSPLLDLLNLRYLIVPSTAQDTAELVPLIRRWPSVYADEHVQVLRNPDAFPRAWLVHAARQSDPDKMLSTLDSGAVDPAREALLETAPPSLAPAARPKLEHAQYTRLSPDRFAVSVTAQAPALLVLSEIWDPGWQASVDGAPATLYHVNFLFQGVAIPPGDHVVTLTYEPPHLMMGLGITTATFLLVIGIGTWFVYRERRSLDGRSVIRSNPATFADLHDDGAR